MKRWTEKEINKLRQYYPKRGGVWCAKHLNRTVQAVNQKAFRLGINTGALWTEHEKERLAKMVDEYTKSDLAKKLNRSVNAVNNMRNNMELGGFLDNTEYLLLKDVSELVGLDKAVITKIWIRDGLQSEKRGYYRIFKQEDLLKFMENNQDKWNARNTRTKQFIQR